MTETSHLHKIKTARGDKLHLRNSYSICHSMAPYFSPKARSLGGPIAATKDAKYITCPYKDGFTVVNTKNSHILKHYEEIDDTLLCLCITERCENRTDNSLAGIEVFTGWQSSLIRQYHLETEALIRGDATLSLLLLKHPTLACSIWLPILLNRKLYRVSHRRVLT